MKCKSLQTLTTVSQMQTSCMHDFLFLCVCVCVWMTLFAWILMWIHEHKRQRFYSILHFISLFHFICVIFCECVVCRIVCLYFSHPLFTIHSNTAYSTAIAPINTWTATNVYAILIATGHFVPVVCVAFIRPVRSFDRLQSCLPQQSLCGQNGSQMGRMNVYVTNVRKRQLRVMINSFNRA